MILCIYITNTILLFANLCMMFWSLLLGVFCYVDLTISQNTLIANPKPVREVFPQPESGVRKCDGSDGPFFRWWPINVWKFDPTFWARETPGVFFFWGGGGGWILVKRFQKRWLEQTKWSRHIYPNIPSLKTKTFSEKCWKTSCLLKWSLFSWHSLILFVVFVHVWAVLNI